MRRRLDTKKLVEDPSRESLQHSCERPWPGVVQWPVSRQQTATPRPRCDAHAVRGHLEPYVMGVVGTNP
ncbi:hypothetical protein NDU88_005715 [Pleurodeles waltl]|uniref:Uncharacterized protein n=1 Tax=Pleurodeles waltl TaxID=8319 RepID=A0AAV7L593_PLEWA|nr:hypothetical protein NDU88_005715 [Pleurodeles waltl]